MPAAALTPEAVSAALADYIDFSAGPVVVDAMPKGAGDLKKGMLVEEVDAILGRPESITQYREGTLTVSMSVYRANGRKVTAEFVEGVMVRFSVVVQ